MDYEHSLYSTCAFCKEEMEFLTTKIISTETESGIEYETVGDIYFCKNDKEYTLHDFATDMCSTMTVDELKESVIFNEINVDGELEYKESLFMFLQNLRQESKEWSHLLDSKLNLEVTEFFEESE